MKISVLYAIDYSKNTKVVKCYNVRFLINSSSEVFDPDNAST